MFDKDAKRFWHKVYELSNVKATTNVSTIAGKVGQIADMWKQYYEQLYCAKYDNVTMPAFLDKLTSLRYQSLHRIVFS